MRGLSLIPHSEVSIMNYEKVIVIKPGTKDLLELDIAPGDEIARRVGTCIIPKPIWQTLKLFMRKSSDGSKPDSMLDSEFDKRLVQALGANDMRQKEIMKNGTV